MSAKVVIYNEGPDNIAFDDGDDIVLIHPRERKTTFVSEGEVVTLFKAADEAA